MNAHTFLIQRIGLICCAILLCVSAINISNDLLDDWRGFSAVAARGPFELGTSFEFLTCALAALMMLFDRPRSAALLACLVLVATFATWRYSRPITPLVADRTLIPVWFASGVPDRLVRIVVLVPVMVAAVCLPLSLARSRIAPEIRVGLVLFLGIAIAAGAFAVAIETTLGGGLATDPARTVTTLSLGLLAIAMIAYAGLLDTVLLGRPGPWAIVALALAVAICDLVATGSGAARWAYVLVVLGGLLFVQRVFVRVFALVAVGLTLFGLAAAPRGEIATFAGVADVGLAIAAMLLAALLVDRTLRARQAYRQIADQTAAFEQLTGAARFELDLASMTLTASPAFELLHGLAPQPRHDWRSFVATHVPAHHHAALAASLAAARRGDPADPLAYSVLRPDGESRDLRLRWVPIRDHRGAIARLTGIVQDIPRDHDSVRGNTDMWMQPSQAQKLETLGLLAGGVAHDLNNTLVPVTILAPLVLESITDPTDRQSVALIIDSAQRARELARDMLAYTREEPVALERIRLDALIREQLPLLRARVPAEITIVDALAPVPAMAGNMCQLYQIVLNLTVNAAQAIGPRGGTITIGTVVEPGEDDERGGRSIRLFVGDDGPGIDPAALDHIFEPFFSTKQGDEASGIGLAIVRRIVQTHGGVISAESVPGQGARFDLLFPAAAPARGRTRPNPANEALWQSAST